MLGGQRRVNQWYHDWCSVHFYGIKRLCKYIRVLPFKLRQQCKITLKFSLFGLTTICRTMDEVQATLNCIYQTKIHILALFPRVNFAALTISHGLAVTKLNQC